MAVMFSYFLILDNVSSFEAYLYVFCRLILNHHQLNIFLSIRLWLEELRRQMPLSLLQIKESHCSMIHIQVICSLTHESLFFSLASSLSWRQSCIYSFPIRSCDMESFYPLHILFYKVEIFGQCQHYQSLVYDKDSKPVYLSHLLKS